MMSLDLFGPLPRATTGSDSIRIESSQRLAEFRRSLEATKPKPARASRQLMNRAAAAAKSRSTPN